MLEENHYYPFGLDMAGISDKALKPHYAENKYRFNGIEHNNDLDLNMYDATYRNFDPQLRKVLANRSQTRERDIKPICCHVG